jgi:hypothetical protein
MWFIVRFSVQNLIHNETSNESLTNRFQITVPTGVITMPMNVVCYHFVVVVAASLVQS